MTKADLDSKLTKTEEFFKINTNNAIDSLKSLKEKNVKTVEFRYDIGAICYPDVYEYLKDLKGVNFIYKIGIFIKGLFYSSDNFIELPIEKAIKHINLHFPESIGYHQISEDKKDHVIHLDNRENNKVVDRMIINYVTN